MVRSIKFKDDDVDLVFHIPFSINIFKSFQDEVLYS